MRVAAVIVVGLVLASAAHAQPRRATDVINEFANPSSHQPPAPTAFNTTPACAPTKQNGFNCEVPTSALPPQDPSNPEYYLNSAYWPAEKRPDIEQYAIQVYGYHYKNCLAQLPHYCFLLDAEAVGYPVSHTPQVGDLWLARCPDLTWMNGGSAGCGGDTGWYLGYVDQVFPDGSFIQSWGGSTTAADSGLSLSWMSGVMDANTEFIGFFPSGNGPRPNSVSVDDYNGSVDISSDAPNVTASATNKTTGVVVPLRIRSDGSGGLSASYAGLPSGRYSVCATSGGADTDYQPSSMCSDVEVVPAAMNVARLIAAGPIILSGDRATVVITAKGVLVGRRALVDFTTTNPCVYGGACHGGYGHPISVTLRSKQTLTVQWRSGWSADLTVIVKGIVAGPTRYAGVALQCSRTAYTASFCEKDTN